MLVAALLVMLGPGLSLSYCALHNPGFTSPPRVQQVSLTSVRVDWLGLVTRIDCADQFIVKSWNVHNPNDYHMSDLLPLDQFSYIVMDLVPNQDYVFQAVAREDKGILGKDWNKSPGAQYRTNSQNPTVAPSPRDRQTGPTRLLPAGGAEARASPKALFTLGAIVVGILLGVLVIVGIVWNIIQSSRRKKAGGESDSESSDSDTDSLELELENTDLESRVGSIRRPHSRAASRVSTLRSQTLRGSRVKSPRRFSLTLSEPSESGFWSRWGETSETELKEAPPGSSKEVSVEAGGSPTAPQEYRTAEV